MKLVEDNVKKSQEEQKKIEDEDLQEESVCVGTGENVDAIPKFNKLEFSNKNVSVETNYATCMYTHSDQECYISNIAAKTFTSKSMDTRHIDTQTNKKPFTYICSKSSTQKCHINLDHSHTNEKTFTCTICRKSFSNKSHLARHIHTKMRNHSHVPYVRSHFQINHIFCVMFVLTQKTNHSHVPYVRSFFPVNHILCLIFVITQTKNHSHVPRVGSHFPINHILRGISVLTKMRNHSHVQCVRSHFLINAVS